jgi:hypothetical protein
MAENYTLTMHSVAEHFWYVFIRFARIRYRRFIPIRYKFKHSTYIQEPLVIEGIEYRERFKRENG